MVKRQYISDGELVSRIKHVIQAFNAKDFMFKTPAITLIKLTADLEKFRVINFSSYDEDYYSIFDGLCGIKVFKQNKKVGEENFRFVRFELYRFDVPDGSETTLLATVMYVSSDIATDRKIEVGELHMPASFQSFQELHDFTNKIMIFASTVQRAIE